MKKPTYRHTVYACYLGYIVQAVVNNFAPLLFLTFRRELDISLEKIALLVSINFLVQLGVDLLLVKLIDRIGYRKAALAADAFSFVGLVALGLFPDWFPDPYVGLVTAVALYAIGGGLLEVIVSPIVEACPSDNKEAAMSLLHSFYCWGHVGVVLISALFFFVFGVSNWRVLACLWALIPLGNAFLFARVPLRALNEGEKGMPVRRLLLQPMFWLLMLMMFASGASEQAMSQWASAFAEAGLGISKTLGDLLGPCVFAATMGLSRAFFGKRGASLPLERFMLFSACLCVACYLLASLCALPALAMMGCGLCGLSVGIFWPGSFSIAARELRTGGNALFAFLALAGDLGCASGPAAVGVAAAALGDDVKRAVLVGVVFPILMLIAVGATARRGRRADGIPSR